MSARPRILFITSDVPRDGGSGGQIASWRLLESFAAAGTVDVVAVGPPDVTPSRELEEVADRVRVVELPHFYFARARVRTSLILAGAMLRREPFRIAKSRSAEASRVIRGWLAESRYDVIHCDHLSSSSYRALAPDTPAILTEHDIEWQQFSQLAQRHPNPLARAVLRADSNRTRVWEARALGDFGHILVLSAGDRSRLLESRPDLQDSVSVWPIPVSVSPLPAPPGPPRFIALGALTSVGRRDGLRWFLDHVWPRVREEVPKAGLDIVGAGPPAEIRALDGAQGVSVHGFLEDLEPILTRTTACVIPLFIGSGIRVKVLELIARAIPCVGTPVGLQGSMPLDGCFEVLEPDQWATTLAEISANSEAAREQAGRGAARLALENSPAAADARVEEVLRRIGVLAPAG